MRPFAKEHGRDVCGGALMVVLGLGAMAKGATYDIGTLDRMGPGFFPVALGAILVFIGVMIAVNARWAAPEQAAEKLPPEWRGWLLITLSIVAFVVVGAYFGLLPAAFAIVFISALADRQNTLRSALVLAVAIAAIGVVVFWWVLQVQFPLLHLG